MANDTTSSTTPTAPQAKSVSIWWFAFGYFAAYVPYTTLVKAATNGLFDGIPALSGIRILPLSVFASVVGMYTFLGAMRWFKHASWYTVAGLRLPGPSKWTFFSGLCTAAIVATTTLAYTFEGVSIVFVMLLMRGGVLVMAPLVDTLSGRKTRWFSWAGLVLSMAALVVAFAEKGGTAITFACALDVGVYIASYFVRLRLMTQLAKSDTDGDANRRYFVEEQLVATPAVFLLLAVCALIGGPDGSVLGEVRAGFVDIWSNAAWPWIVVVGLCSQFTGVFGGLILLDKSENTFSVPVNRSSSIIAGVVSSAVLTYAFGLAAPSTAKLMGAGLIIVAILFLSIPPLVEKKKAEAKAT
mgnify:CR=1 FL=1